MKILFVFGTRPEAIKLGPVIKRILINKNFKTKICITAQHRKLLDQTLQIFQIKPHYDLNIMIENQPLEYITLQILQKLKPILKKEKPDLTIVQGDTTTAFITALVCFYEKIKVAHIEAGLRTYDKYNPFPEEINRVLLDRLSDIHFVPTFRAKENLRKENFKEDTIFICGNTVVDALKTILKKENDLHSYFADFKDVFLKKFFSRRNNSKIILLTAHRRESFGKGLENVFTAIKKISLKYKNISVFYPVHPNPNVKNLANRMLKKIKNVYLIEPLNYLDLLKLMKKSYLIITDSGGIQEEAPSLSKPVLVIREKTERPEGVELGIAKLVGLNSKNIFLNCCKLIEDKNEYRKMIKNINPYGDGKASQRIIAFLEYYFGLSNFRPKEFS